MSKTIQWNGDNILDIYVLMSPATPQYMSGFSDADRIVGVWTSMGLRVAHLGDWITKLEDGSFRVDKRIMKESQ